MKINQVEELVGITKKNIRFYEDQGLIKPERDPENRYREYSMGDVEKLLRIKLLRQLDVPCETIRKVTNGELSLDSCMAGHMDVLSKKQTDLEHAKEICGRLKDEVNNLTDLNASGYLEEMERLRCEEDQDRRHHRCHSLHRHHDRPGSGCDLGADHGTPTHRPVHIY